MKLLPRDNTNVQSKSRRLTAGPGNKACLRCTVLSHAPGTRIHHISSPGERHATVIYALRYSVSRTANVTPGLQAA